MMGVKLDDLESYLALYKHTVTLTFKKKKKKKKGTSVKPQGCFSSIISEVRDPRQSGSREALNHPEISYGTEMVSTSYWREGKRLEFIWKLF